MTVPVVRTVAEADLVAAVISHGLSTMPVNGPVRALLVDLRARARAFSPPSSADGTGLVVVPDDDLVDVEQASILLRVTPEAVRKRCRLRQIPGAQKIAGVWLIPAGALPEHEDHDDDHRAA